MNMDKITPYAMPKDIRDKYSWALAFLYINGELEVYPKIQPSIYLAYDSFSERIEESPVLFKKMVRDTINRAEALFNKQLNEKEGGIMVQDLIEMIQRNKFGICPRCGKHLHLLNSIYQLYTMSENGWISKEMGKNVVSKAVCRDCGFKMDMKVTINGLVPVSFKGELPESTVLKNNPVGVVEE